MEPFVEQPLIAVGNSASLTISGLMPRMHVCAWVCRHVPAGHGELYCQAQSQVVCGLRASLLSLFNDLAWLCALVSPVIWLVRVIWSVL